MFSGAEDLAWKPRLHTVGKKNQEKQLGLAQRPARGGWTRGQGPAMHRAAVHWLGMGRSEKHGLWPKANPQSVILLGGPEKTSRGIMIVYGAGQRSPGHC